MSVPKAHEYLQRYADDQGFRDRIREGSREDQRAALEEAGFGDLRREHVEQAHSDHVDDADLDDVSGGTSPMASSYMEAMMAFYNTNSSDIMNKGNEMADGAGQAAAVAKIEAENWRASR